jgi:hypothetical protein
MATKKFSSVYVSNLSLNNTHALINSTIVAATSNDTAPLGDVVNLSLANMQAKCTDLGGQLNKTKKSPLTQQINNMRKDRKSRWRVIKSIVAAHKKGSDVDKKAAATSLYIFMKSYWNLEKLPLNTETDQVKDMLAKFNGNDDLGAHALFIGIDVMMGELGAVNTTIDALYRQRTVEGGKKKAPSASALKSAAVASYRQFCAVVEHVVNLMPNDSLTALFSTIEELRKIYTPLASKPGKKPIEKLIEKSAEIPADNTTISAN